MPKSRFRRERVARTMPRPQQQNEALIDDVRKLLGLAPYNSPANYLYQDGYFAHSLRSRYGDRLVEAEIKRQRRKG